MTLPQLKVHFHTADLPVAKRKVKYRAWLKGEDKALLVARQIDMDVKESGNAEGSPEVVANAVGQIVTAVTDGAVNPDVDSYVDVLYVFALSRARAAGGMATVILECGCEKSGPEPTKVNATINISHVMVDYPEAAPKEIEVGETNDGEKVVIVLRQPSYNAITRAQSAEDADAEMMRSCVEKIFTESASFPVADLTEAEWKSFVNSMTRESYDGIEKFIASQPQAYVVAHGRCPKCKQAVTRKLMGLGRFF